MSQTATPDHQPRDPVVSADAVDVAKDDAVRVADPGTTRRAAVRFTGIGAASEPADAHQQAAPAERDEALSVEAPLEIRLNGRAFSITMRTPGEDSALVRGLLLAEGVLGPEFTRFALRVVERDAAGTAVAVDLDVPPVYLCDGLFQRRSLTAVAACGLCGQRSLDDLPDDLAPLPEPPPLRLAAIPAGFAALQAAQAGFRATGGCHAAAAIDADAGLLACHEDVGRHNAVDKVVGDLLLAGRLPAARVLLVSGRVSFELVLKAWRAGIPYLAAVSAPSSLAVDLADRAGITLLAYCRADRATAYTHPGRLLP